MLTTPLATVTRTPAWRSAAYEQAKKPHIAQATGESEWYTPQEYIDVARIVLGEIDLDPASAL